MDYASLQDAFPTEGGQPSRRKKRTPRDGYTSCEVPNGGPDPDRPAYRRMFDVPPMKQPETDGVPDTLLDESTKFQAKPTVMNSLPKVQDLISPAKPSGPKFFGAEPFVNPAEDTRAVYTDVEQPNSFMLNADFTKSFDMKGFDRPTGSTLPVPELRHRWKSMSNGVESSFYEPQKPTSQFQGLDTSDIQAMKSKLDSLMARIDDLEYRSNGSNPQLEMMSFILVGLFLMFGLDVAVRKSGGMRLLNVS
jgi:hypothetical protein